MTTATISFRIYALAVVLILLNSHLALSWDDSYDNDEDQYGFGNRYRLPQPKGKGTYCNPKIYNSCYRKPAKGGTGILQCCNGLCRDVTCDGNHCGRCGHRCGFGQLCCSGNCIKVSFNAKHCGKCNHECKHGRRCQYGICGYA